MSIFFLSCLLLLCMCMPSSATTTTTPFRQCFEALVNLTQRCDNHNFFYSTTMGFGQGFGSEFNMYFIKSMIRAVLSNRRYVYLDSKRPWEYNCAENSGWACYFSIPPCTDGVARSKDLDFSVRPSADKYESPGSVLFDREEMGDYIFRNNEFLNAMRKLSATKAYKDLLPSGVCSGLPDDTVFYASDLGGPSAQRLFHFNNRTTIGVQGINARYEHLSRKPYASMFMRLTDKQGEMPEEDWALISNTTFVAYRFLEVLHNHTVKHGLKPGHLRDIYMATDDCVSGDKVLQVLLPKGFRIFGTCFHADGKSIIAEKMKGWNPRFPLKTETREANTHLLLAEMDMLRKGSVFLGSIQSNIGRLLHYLRYPRYEDTYSMTPHFMSTGIDRMNFFF